jgi:predicted CXXCH cytochrome family protein
VSATSASTSDTIANSYRFLGGIMGLENVGWNWSETTSSHNEYYGQANTHGERDDDTTDTYEDTDTMSYFCGQCHGFFHSRIVASGAGITSPWVRHPTDIVLPNSGGYANYNNDGGPIGSYSLSVPIARGAVATNAQGSRSTVIANDSSTVDGAIVMCLSCHRAHGSPEDDLLRFTYSNMVVGNSNTTGCFVCHTDKN